MKKNWNEWEMWANNIIYHTVGQLIILLVARLAGMSPPQRMAIWFVPHLPAWNFPLKKFGSWYSPPPPPTWTSLVWILIAELATSSFSEPFCPAPKPVKRPRKWLLYWEGERQSGHLTQQSCFQRHMPLTTKKIFFASRFRTVQCSLLQHD